MANAMTYGAAVAGWDAMVPPPRMDAHLLAELLAPRFVERPPIRVPRSLRRAVSDRDLQAAADMMTKLRRRDDARTLAAQAVVTNDAERVLDVTVDRLLMVL